jgi:hypothetical protein
MNHAGEGADPSPPTAFGMSVAIDAPSGPSTLKRSPFSSVAVAWVSV